jgi:Rad3-related DNA helicase
VRSPDAHHVERREQLEMASAVAAAIDERTPLVVEAGTGVGKTCAYLVPALLSGARTLLSTALDLGTNCSCATCRACATPSACR